MRLKRILFAAISLGALLSFSVAARVDIKVEKPDLNKIRLEVLNPKSPYYFPKLKAEYDRNDTVMTPEKYRYFYLGYMFQEDYDPYRESEFSKHLDDLRDKVEPYTRQELDTISTYSELALEDNPFDLRQMSFLIHALKQRGKTYRAKFWEYRLENLLGAIKSTGTGEDPENAWYVIYPMHEYDMVQLLGYEAVDAEFPSPGVDYLLVEPEPETAKRLRGKVAKGFYFNVDIPNKQYILKHPGEDEGIAQGADSDETEY